MDVDVGAGRDSTWRRGAGAADEDDAGGRGMEAQVVPLELYDSARAKIDANLRWLFAKAYGIDHIPADLRDPFYTDQYEQEHIKPLIIRLLLSGELYCRVCGLVLHAEQAAALQSHQSVIQALSRKGIYVLQADNSPVSDLDLGSLPIKMSAHIHLIDALMMAYIVEMISIEKVVSGVKRFSNFSASKELPFDLEDAMLFWINKVNMKMREIVEKELKMKQHLLDSPSHQKSPSKWYWKLVPVRYRRDHLSGRTLQHFPLLDDLLKDVSDGTALLAVIHFYCPELVRLEDICLKEVPSIADSVYNIQLLQEFSNEYLNKCFYLKPEDVLYSPPVLKNNMLVFIAELFWWFESVKPEFVQPRDLHEIRDVRLLLQPKTSRPHIPISNVTKRSFLTSSNSADTLMTPPGPELSSKTNSLSPSHSLLPLRQRQQKVEENTSELRNRSNSTTRTDGHHQGSLMAWPERRQRPLSQPVPYALHYPLEDDADSISLARSISKDSLASNIMSITPKHMLGSGPPLAHHRLSGQSLLSHMRIEDEEQEIEEEELVAVIHPSAFPRRRLGSDMEQDELEVQSAASASRVSNPRCPPRIDTPERQADGYYLEPLMPAVPKPAKEKSISLNKEEESGEGRCRAAARRAAASVPSTSQRKAPESNVTPAPEVESTRPPTEGSVSQPVDKQPHGFFLHLSAEPERRSAPLEAGQDSDSDIADLEEDEEEDDPMELKRGKGKYYAEGEACDFAEGEGESAKLRDDLKVSERDDKEDCSGRSSPCLSTASWASSCSASGSVKMTSFAERKLLKLGLRDGFSSTSSSQKTTPDGSEVAPCPPWQLRSDWMAKEPISVLGKNMAVSPAVVPSELLQLHMQLEEQRRAIEHQKKKMETLSARQRLKLGKAAFLNIVKKGGGRSDTLPLPLKHSESAELADRSRGKTPSCKDDSCLDALKVQGRASPAEGGQVKRESRLNALSQDNVAEPDLNECTHSIDLLNEAISSIQHQMMQLSLQQDLLMKHVVSPPEPVETGPSTTASMTQFASPTTANTSQFASPTTAHMTQFASPTTANTTQFASPTTANTSQFASPTTANTSKFASPTTANTSQFASPTTAHMTQFASPTTANTTQFASPTTANTSQFASPTTANTSKFASPTTANTSQFASPTTAHMTQFASPTTANTTQFASPTTANTSQFASPTTANTSQFASPTTANTTHFASPTTASMTQLASPTSESKSFAVHFVDIGGSASVPARRPPKLSSSQRSKASEQKQSRDGGVMASIKTSHQSVGEDSGGDQKAGGMVESSRPERNIKRKSTFRVQESLGRRGSGEGAGCTSKDPRAVSSESLSSSDVAEQENNDVNSGKEAENARSKGQLIEVDLSEVKDSQEEVVDVSDGTAEQKNALGFFFKDDEKAEDEMAKRRAAFLLKQQRKAEESRLRKQQHEAESELKRDEARRKAEEDRIRKEEEKARRELIKQEYLQRKQDALLEEQGLVKPRPRTKSRRSRPKSLHREESGVLSKGSTTRHSLKVSMLIKGKGSAAGSRGADLSCSHRGSTLSLATEADSVISGGAESQRAGSVCSMDYYPVLSRASSRNMERDWENGSIASSITSMEYNGPKLFKEPSSKSNKPIIINAIAHCCMAGKVNEVQKNAVLEELEKCESNHLIILFRDGGCQFRGIYGYSPDTEEIVKFTGTGPRAITSKMVDKLYKYSSDRKQFSIIPAKSVSVSVDALTIHNHLWQVKRPGSARRK